MQYRDPRAAEARRLRIEEGLSSKEIRERLDVEKNQLQYWLAGLPTSEGLRPQARDDLKAKARELRAEGKTYDEIVEALGVSQSSVSLWVRDIPVEAPEVHRGWTTIARQRRAETYAKKHAQQRDARLERQAFIHEALGPFDVRDILISGAVAYWCEGAKVKPWRPQSVDVNFINSDPNLVRLFLRFLDAVPVAHGGASFRIHLHENGAEERAKEYWCRELGIGGDDFLPTVWKRHNPKTIRKNTGDGYHGCIVVRPRKCTDLYWFIEDLAKSTIGAMSDARTDWGTVT